MPAVKPTLPVSQPDVTEFWESIYGQHDPHALAYSQVLDFAEQFAGRMTAERDRELQQAREGREHTHRWYASHYGKLQDWARNRLPDPWRNEFFNCIANGTWGHDDVGEPYMSQVGRIVPSGYFKMDTAAAQILSDQTIRAESAEKSLSEAREELARLNSILNTPETEDFDKAVPLEASHQVLRWGANHDSGKNPEDWFWLVGYLAGKALSAFKAGDLTKAKHHTISTSAALRNWHAHIRSGDSRMRPGLSGDKTAPFEAVPEEPDTKL